MPINKIANEEHYKNYLILKNYLSKFTNRAYLVGGSVRDIFLNRQVSDLDIEVYDVCKNDFKKIMQDFGAIGVGKSFFVYKWKNIDISLPRVEKKIGIGHKAFEIQITTNEKEASRRRDFTMNALMINIFNNKLLDFWGGVKDIQNKMIKIVSKNSFAEDSLRVLRAIEFSARFGFKCEKQSLKIMQDISLNDLSKERIFWEFEKLFNAKYLHYGLYYCCKLDIFHKIFHTNINKLQCYQAIKIFYKHQKYFYYEVYKFYFLYIVSKVFNLNIFELLKTINAPKEYEKFYKKQINYLYKNNLSDQLLLETSLIIPIKFWLENYQKNIIKRAINFHVFQNKLKTDVKSSEVLKDGFKGKEIGLEIKKRNLEYIKKMLIISKT